VFKPVDRIQKMIVTFPARFKTSRALEMGFKADTDIRSIIEAYIKEQG
jgi:hypothetical protein